MILMAEAIFCDPGSRHIKGTVAFSQRNSKYVRVDINLKNVPTGLHGIHIHENGIKFFSMDDYAMQAGKHFNGSMKHWTPKLTGGTKHGSYFLNTERHIGDLCNNIVSFTGSVYFSYIDKLISLVEGHPHCILGKSIIIRKGLDDEGLFKSKKIKDTGRFIQSKMNGNCGGILGCSNVQPIL